MNLKLQRKHRLLPRDIIHLSIRKRAIQRNTQLIKNITHKKTLVREITSHTNVIRGMQSGYSKTIETICEARRSMTSYSYLSESVWVLV